jgi:hypothetical protein
MGSRSGYWRRASHTKTHRRIGISVTSLIIISTVAAFLVTIIFHLGPGQALLALILGGVALPGLYLDYGQTLNSEPQDSEPQDKARPDGDASRSEPFLKELAGSVDKQWREESGACTFSDITAVQAHEVTVNSEHSLLHALPRLSAALIHADPPTRQGADPHAVQSTHR